MSEKDSIRESFIAFQKRLEETVELFHSLRNENAQLRGQIEMLQAELAALTARRSDRDSEVAKLINERKLVRDKVEKLLQTVSLLQSRTLG